MRFFCRVNPNLSSQNGFSLIELMLGLGISLIGMLAIFSAMNSLLGSVGFINDSAARNELAASVRRTILDRRSLGVTVSKNPVMDAVVNNKYAAFGSVISNKDYPIKIYDASGMLVAGSDTVAGVPAQPAFYTTDGYPCTTSGQQKCLISVVSKFMIQGFPRYGTVHNVIPTPSYPSWDPTLKPDFMQVSFSINYLDTDASGIARKPVNGAVFIAFEDLSN